MGAANVQGRSCDECAWLLAANILKIACQCEKASEKYYHSVTAITLPGWVTLHYSQTSKQRLLPTNIRSCPLQHPIPNMRCFHQNAKPQLRSAPSLTGFLAALMASTTGCSCWTVGGGGRRLM